MMAINIFFLAFTLLQLKTDNDHDDDGDSDGRHVAKAYPITMKVIKDSCSLLIP